MLIIPTTAMKPTLIRGEYVLCLTPDHAQDFPRRRHVAAHVA